MDTEHISAAQEHLQAIKNELATFFIGQDQLVEHTLVALVANGHLLVESVPGLGKTLLVKAIGKIIGMDTGRIQFTPDLMPSDITGSHIFDMAERKFVFRKGPIFTQFLLADEFNRAPAKTHSALLEVMQERQVTLDGTRYPLAAPFLVMATQNPIENEGTYNLPEAQLDRFLFKLTIDYPVAEEEERILHLFLNGESPDKSLNLCQQISTPERLLELQELAAQITAHPSIITYISSLVRATRQYPGVYLGASPRAGIALLTAGRAQALMSGRDFLVPDDIMRIAVPAMRHRLILSPEAEVEGKTPEGMLNEIIRTVEVPKGYNE